MLDLLIPLSWVLSGVVLSALLADRTASRWRWAPIAAVLGPMWLAVAVDQRATDGQPVVER